MKTEILIYALERGETRRYTEHLISTQCQTAADIEKVKTAASAAGFHSFRVTTYDGSAPNFAKAINI
jgi:hypothetical protein